MCLLCVVQHDEPPGFDLPIASIGDGGIQVHV